MHSTTDTRSKALAAVSRRAVSSAGAHMWSDALFARERARDYEKRIEQLHERLEETPSTHRIAHLHAELVQCAWDRGVYVRWTITTAWTAFERACELAFPAASVNKGKRGLLGNISNELQALGLAPLDLKTRPWSLLNETRELRNKFTHRDCLRAELLTSLSDAENSIETVRSCLIDLFARLGRTPPTWIESDSVPRSLGGSMAWLAVVHAGALDDPEPVSVRVVFGGHEIETAVMKCSDDPWPSVEHTVVSVMVPIRAIRIYKGSALVEEVPVDIRGT